MLKLFQLSAMQNHQEPSQNIKEFLFFFFFLKTEVLAAFIQEKKKET